MVRVNIIRANEYDYGKYEKNIKRIKWSDRQKGLGCENDKDIYFEIDEKSASRQQFPRPEHIQGLTLFHIKPIYVIMSQATS